jgi:hypothetical protein
MLQRMRSLLIFLAASVSLATQASSAAVPNSPRSFLDRVIAYETSGSANLQSSTFLALLTPRLRAAVQADTIGVNIGVLDYDPICQCQDKDGLKMRILSLAGRGSTAMAIVENIHGGKRTRVRFRLALTGEGWRLADVMTSEQPPC